MGFFQSFFHSTTASKKPRRYESEQQLSIADIPLHSEPIKALKGRLDRNAPIPAVEMETLLKSEAELIHSLYRALPLTDVECQTHIFSDELSAKANFKNNGRWYLACCLAGFMHDVGKVVTNVTVSSRDGHFIWRPLSETLSAWLQREQIKDYCVSWKTASKGYALHEMAGPLLFPMIVPAQTRRFLEQSDSVLRQALRNG